VVNESPLCHAAVATARDETKTKASGYLAVMVREQAYSKGGATLKHKTSNHPHAASGDAGE
jgi:hypothetical protein